MSGGGGPQASAVKGYVEVVFNYESTSEKGHSVNVHKGERYALLNSLDDEWWFVGKSPNDQEGFYLPRSYIRPLDTEEAAQMSTFRANVRSSCLYEMAKTNYSPKDGENSASLRVSAVSKRPSSEDPHVKRLSKSIPVSLNFAHDILLDIPVANDQADPTGPVRTDSTDDCHNESAPLPAEPEKVQPRGKLDSYEEEPSDLANSQTISTSEEENNLASSDEEIDVSEASPSGLTDSPLSKFTPELVSRHRSYQSAIQASEHIYANTTDLRVVGEANQNRFTTNFVDDKRDSAIYANLPGIPVGRQDLLPAAPDETDLPLRQLTNGWAEYFDKAGRRYFYNSSTKSSSWKPPRNSNVLLKDSGNSTLLTSSGEDMDSSLSGTDELEKSQTCDDIIEQRVVVVDQRQNASKGVYYSPVPISDSSIHAIEPHSPIAPAPPPKPQKPRESMLLMGSSGDSGKYSLKFVNPGFGLPAAMSRSADDALAGHSSAADSSSLSRNGTISSVEHNIGINKGPNRASILPGSRKNEEVEEKPLMQGALNKCKFAEGGKRIKKQWDSAYLLLIQGHLIFYKDQKSSEKKGISYDTPQCVCDLRGAKISNEDVTTKRKNVFQLDLINGSSYLFQATDQIALVEWYRTISGIIAKLPKPDSTPSSGIEMEPFRFARRNSDIKKDRLDDSFGAQKKGAKKDKDVKEKRSSGLFHSNSMNHGDQSIEISLSRQTILERLRKFFRQRPTIDALREKGIYKPEPVFGSSLMEICKREKTTIPKFIRVSAEVIEDRGLDADGLYRISGNLSQIQKIRCQVDQELYNDLVGEEDIHVLTGALKLFFRELQEPLFPLSMTKDFLTAIKIQNGKQRVATLKDLIKRLPPPHHDTLDFLLKHLLKVAAQSSKNRMQPHNLAIVFGPTLFSTSPSNAQANLNGAKKGAKPTGNRKTSAGPQSNSSGGETVPSAGSQSNSHVAFNMIMQGQIVEFLLANHSKIFS